MTNLEETYNTFDSTYEELCHGRAWPLPRRNLLDVKPEEFEVVVAGAGPAGLSLTLILARLGLTDESLLCVDGQEGATQIGHADGINARTLEILATLDLEAEILKKGCPFTNSCQWERTEQGLNLVQMVPLPGVSARYEHYRTLHQGRVERIMLEDLSKYSRRQVEYSTKIVDARIDESNKKYPVLVSLESKGQIREVRTKYLVGADGAHSNVRRSMGLVQEGESIDRIFCVMDFVPETNFQHIRRVNMLFDKNHTQYGLIIPRESMSNGDQLVRFYCQMDTLDQLNGEATRAKMQQVKEEIGKEEIFEQVQKCIAPHKIRIKEGTEPCWWATYSVGQRLANRFHVEDSQGHPRVFLVGDACHTHSPLQGQGMNISIQDSYNLSWKLAHAVLGHSQNPVELLKSYEFERRPAAERVVFFDKRWNQSNMPFDEKYNEMRSQITGCGVEFEPSMIVSSTNSGVDLKDKDLLSGVLKVGRRIRNMKVMRYADDALIDLHDNLPATGKYRILLLTDHEFLNGRSRRVMEDVCNVSMKYSDLLEAIILQPDTKPSFVWPDLPSIVKAHAEMRFYCADKEVYDTYGVDPDQGAIALIRPDGMVAMTVELHDLRSMEQFLKTIISSPHQVNGI